MVTPPYQALRALAENDRKFVILSARQEELTKRKNTLLNHLKTEQDKFTTLQAQHAHQLQTQSAREVQLRQEEERIVERRKQMSNMGGSKGAKYLERDIDTAARALQQLEEQVIRAMEESDRIGKHLEAFRSALDDMGARYAKEIEEINQNLELSRSESIIVSGERAALVDAVNPKFLSLYDRVRKRFPADPVAIAREEGCESCHRSIPKQTLNLVSVGDTLYQCPGCNRILLAATEAE
ncbi:MAG: hypothetical protein IT290_05765 [Deltaproteobacteria bacterium]|nr:hypothetical protein [Deltaproteobacteria bacterium]